MGDDRTNHERDARDRRWWDEGDLTRLIHEYWDYAYTRAALRTRDRALAEDVRQAAFLRLMHEHRMGRRYSVPVRVVIVKLCDWTAKELLGAPHGFPLPDGWDPAASDGALDEVEFRLAVEGTLHVLAPREAEVVRLRWLEDREIEEIADRLGMARNAVDQALHRAHAKMRDEWER